MMYFRPLLYTLFLVTIASHAQFTDVINSNRPGRSMAAFSVGKTVIQAEAGIYAYEEEHNLLNYDAKGFGGDLAVRYGAFFEQLEFIMELQYQADKFSSPLVNDRRSGLSQTTIGAKYLVYDPWKNYEKKPNLYSWKANHSFSYREFIPAVGIYAGVNLQLGDNPFDYGDEEAFSPKLMLLTQNQFGKWVFVTNIIADKIATDHMTFGYIATLTRGFSQRWSGFIENQGTQNDYYTDGIVRLGAAFLIKENIQIDASIGKNIKETPSIMTGGIGISWRFDDNYEEVLLRVPKDDKKSDKDKKDKKKKDKVKKRLDEVETQP